MPRSQTVSVRWRDKLVFEGGAEGRSFVTVDGDSEEAISPVELFLVSAAACTASDIVLILKKMRVDLKGVDVVLRATRRDEEPRRVTAMHYAWTISGTGADENKARRAIDLSIEKYCSVMASLAQDITVSYDVTLA